MELKTFLLPLVLFVFSFSSLSASKIQNNPSASVEELGHHAGYHSLPRTKSANADPVVIWLTGSMLSLFFENGPFAISEDFSLSWNDFGWDKVSNIIYVDQPVGTFIP